MGSNLKALWAKFKAQLAGIWDKDRGIIILVGIAAIAVKFRDILLSVLINSTKRVDTNAHKDDTKLAKQEDDLKKQADAAVQQSAAEPSKETPVTDDWYEKGN